MRPAREVDPSAAAIRARGPLAAVEFIDAWTSTAEALSSATGDIPTRLTFAQSSPTSNSDMLPDLVTIVAHRNASTTPAVGVGDPVSLPATTRHHVTVAPSPPWIGSQSNGRERTAAHHIALIVLSTLACITILVVIWITWRRRRREKASLEEACQQLEYDRNLAAPERKKPTPSHQESDWSFAGPTLVSDPNSSTRALVHRTEMAMIGSSRAGRKQPKPWNKSAWSIGWPSRSIREPTFRRSARPIPPPKVTHRSPIAPPSSPTITTNRQSMGSHGRGFPEHRAASIHIPVASSRIELAEISPVSPLSDSIQQSKQAMLNSGFPSDRLSAKIENE